MHTRALSPSRVCVYVCVYVRWFRVCLSVGVCMRVHVFVMGVFFSHVYFVLYLRRVNDASRYVLVV